MNLQKCKYFLDSLTQYFTPIICPSCKSTRYQIVDRKYFVLRLFECLNCKLYYRHPLEIVQTNKSFYQTNYNQADGITTFLPEEGNVENLLDSIIKDPSSPKNAQRIIQIINELFPDATNKVKLLDYGSSWGYISWQIQETGIDVQGFEISVPRAEYGQNNLELDIKTEEDQLRSGNDIFFSSHVIEHVPTVSHMLRLAQQLTQKKGYIITLCPNGSPEYRRKDPDGFHKCWGQVHPNYLNANFFIKFFNKNPLFITSTPLDLTALKRWDKESHWVGDVSGDELLVITSPHQEKK